MKPSPSLFKSFYGIILSGTVFSLVTPVSASMITSFVSKVKIVFLQNGETFQNDVKIENSSHISLLDPSLLPKGESDTQSTSDVLEVKSGPMRLSTEEVDYPLEDTITTYEVKDGDTVASVAKLFGVTSNTILWANDIKAGKIKEGDVIVILPVTGIKYKIKEGDTLLSIAKKYKGDSIEIAKYNGLSQDGDLAFGQEIIIPEGEVEFEKVKEKSALALTKKTVRKLATTPLGFFVKPLTWFIKTQGLHGKNGVDLAGKVGSPVVATASGKVIVAKSDGYNGGYGEMVVIAHKNNIQTLYAHMSAVHVSVGDVVTQGQVIGALGNTGHSTGPHLHIEVRGAANPF